MSEENLALMDIIDKQYLETPFYGRRKMTVFLRCLGHVVNAKRVGRLMKKMGIEGIRPRLNTSKPHPEHPIYPYLLRGLDIVKINHVWMCDITYVRLRKGFMYLVAVIDVFSRYVLSWRLSNTLDAGFCVEALEDALQNGSQAPDIFNTDQGAQFTSSDFTKQLKQNGIRISMDGKGRAIDNVFIERLWWSVKYECTYLKQCETVSELHSTLSAYFDFYNNDRYHQSLDYQRPAEVYGAQAVWQTEPCGKPDMESTHLVELSTYPHLSTKKEKSSKKERKATTTIF
jgi:putative transposase